MTHQRRRTGPPNRSGKRIPPVNPCVPGPGSGHSGGNLHELDKSMLVYLRQGKSGPPAAVYHPPLLTKPRRTGAELTSPTLSPRSISPPRMTNAKSSTQYPPTGTGDSFPSSAARAPQGRQDGRLIHANRIG